MDLLSQYAVGGSKPFWGGAPPAALPPLRDCVPAAWGPPLPPATAGIEGWDTRDQLVLQSTRLAALRLPN